MASSESFIKFYNCFMDSGEYKLTPSDWHLYSLIASRWSGFLELSEISISKLTEIQQIYKNKVESQNRLNVKKRIWDMKDRGILYVLNPEGELVNAKNEFNYSKTLDITFNKFDDKFQQIPRQVYDMTSDIYELYAICCIYRFQKMYKGKKGFEKSLKGWELLLECGEDKTREILTSIVDKDIIIRKGWDKNRLDDGKFESTPYEYFVNLGDSKIDKNENVDVDNIEVDAGVSEINWGNWKAIDNKYNNIEYDDCVLYYENINNKKYIDVCNKRLEKIPEKAMFYIQKNLDKAKGNYEHKNRLIVEEMRKIEINKIVNAVTMKGDKDKIIHLSEGNIDQIDFDKVEKIYFYGIDEDGNEKVDTGDFRNLAGVDVSEDMHSKAICEYKEVVRSGEKLTMKLVEELRKKIKEIE